MRKQVSPEMQARILAESRRRCALCFGLHADFSRKTGQIAHLDKDASNDAPENLVFLCFEHHNEYDSITRQSKNITKEELANYRALLLSEVEARWEDGVLDRPSLPTAISLIVNVSNAGGAGGSSVFGGGGGGGGASNAEGGAGGHGSSR
jgi:hypothetical protein